jgi:2-iminobutanoate/2-iminopropanoate deaminase
MNENRPLDIEYITSEKLKSFPFSEAVRIGDTLYLSGQVGLDESLSIVPGGIAEETKQTLENIKATLENCGSSLKNVIKTTVMLVDMNEWPEMNNVYKSYFLEYLPARTAFGVNGLASGARVEIECIAIFK